MRKTDIGKRLWDYMMDNPMSAMELAERIGIAHSTLLTIAHGEIEPRNTVRCKIEKFLKEQTIERDRNDRDKIQ